MTVADDTSAELVSQLRARIRQLKRRVVELEAEVGAVTARMVLTEATLADSEADLAACRNGVYTDTHLDSFTAQTGP